MATSYVQDHLELIVGVSLAQTTDGSFRDQEDKIMLKPVSKLPVERLPRRSVSYDARRWKIVKGASSHVKLSYNSGKSFCIN